MTEARIMTEQATTGVRYTDLQKDAVFTIWAYKADRDSERTVALLVEDQTAIELAVAGVTARTVRNWAKSGDWEDRANRCLFADAPGRRFRTQTALVLAAPEAGEFIRRMVALDESLGVQVPLRDADGAAVLDKNGEPVYFTEFSDKILKLRLTAAQLVLDRTGFSPIGTRDLGDISAPPEMQTDLIKQIAGETDPNVLNEIQRKLMQVQGIGKAAGEARKRNGRA